MGRIEEHALTINIESKGLVLLCGCAHPGIIDMVERAKLVTGVSKVHAVLGGLHVSSYREGAQVAEYFNSIGVEVVSPCHCTGEDAKRSISKIFKGKYVT